MASERSILQDLPPELQMYAVSAVSVEEWGALCLSSRVHRATFCHLDWWEATGTFQEATLEGRNVEQLLFPFFGGRNLIKFHAFAVRLYLNHHTAEFHPFAEERADDWVMREMARRFFEKAGCEGQKALFNALGPVHAQTSIVSKFPSTMRQLHYSVSNTYYARADCVRAGLQASDALEAISIDGVVNLSEATAGCIQRHNLSLRTLSLCNGAWSRKALVAALEKPLAVEELYLRDQGFVDDHVCRLIAGLHQNLRRLELGGTMLLGRAANSITDQGVEALADLPHLEHFGIGYADNVTIASIATMAGKVRSLRIDNLFRLTREECGQLAPFLSGLEAMRLGSSRRLDVEGLCRLLEQASSLRELRLDSWGLTSLTLVPVLERVPSLQRLVIYERLGENTTDLTSLTELFSGLEVVLVTNKEVHRALDAEGGDAVLGGEAIDVTGRQV